MKSLGSALGWSIVLAQALLPACGLRHERASASSTRPALVEGQAVGHGPPAFAFEAPQAWQSRRAGVPAVPPPDLTRETWRVLISQDRPMQKQTPRWQRLPADQSVALRMPPASTFECLVTPLTVTPEPNGYGNRLEAWLLTRSLLCSSDGFRSWTEYPYRVRLHPDGTRDVPDPVGALLRERGGAGQPERHTFALMRSDPEPRAPTTGPPRVLANVQVPSD